MEYSEKQIPFSEEDLSFLRKKRNRVFINVAVMEIIFAALPVSYILHPEIYPEDIGEFVWVAVAIFYLVFIAVTILFSFRYNQDVKSGTKLHIEGRMTKKEKLTKYQGVGNKKTTSTTYWFNFNDTPLMVDWHTFKKVQDGDFVNMEIAGQSGTVLNVEVINRF